MKTILIAVDDTKGAKHAFTVGSHIFKKLNPEDIVLLYVEKLEGRSLIDQMLGQAELSTLAEALKGSDYQEALDKRAREILGYYKKALEDNGAGRIKTVITKGNPAEEIIKVAKQEGAEMIVVGSRGSRTSHLFMGSVSREVANTADIPVLLVK